MGKTKRKILNSNSLERKKQFKAEVHLDNKCSSFNPFNFPVSISLRWDYT